MKTTHKLLSTLMLCLPLLCVSWLWDRLPTRLPVHFTDDGLPDRFASRQEWFSGLLNVLFVLVLIRSVAFALLSNRFGDSQVVRVYLLSAAVVGISLGSIILRALYPALVYGDWLPVLLAFFGAAGVYFTVPTDLSIGGETTKETARPIRSPQQIADFHYLYSLSRLVFIRVNLLAAVLMVFTRSGDRWSIGIMANLLAFIALFVIGNLRRQSS